MNGARVRRGQRELVFIGTRSPARRRDLVQALERDYEVACFDNGRALLRDVVARRPALLLLDVDLDGLSGLQVARRLPDASFVRPRIVVMGQGNDVRLRVFETYDLADAVLPDTTPDGIVLDRLWKVMDARLEREWRRVDPEQRSMLEACQAAFDNIVATVVTGNPLDEAAMRRCVSAMVIAARSGKLLPAVRMLRRHHDASFVHSLQVATNMTVFGMAAGMKDVDVAALTQAGLLHDIGKHLIPLEILNKPAPLNEDEWTIMRRHTIVSGEALRAVGSIPEVAILAAERHHERLDGSGYPHGLSGTRIDDISLIAAVADVHAALTENRAYKTRLSDEEALAIMRDMAGPKLEPRYLRIFESMILDGAHARSAIRPDPDERHAAAATI